MNEVFYIVQTQSHKWLAIPAEWIEFKDLKVSKVFYSNNINNQPDFGLPVKYFFDDKISACYNAYIVRKIGKYKKSRNIT